MKGCEEYLLRLFFSWFNNSVGRTGSTDSSFEIFRSPYQADLGDYRKFLWERVFLLHVPHTSVARRNSLSRWKNFHRHKLTAGWFSLCKIK